MTVIDGAHAVHVIPGPPTPEHALQAVVEAEMVARHDAACGNVHCVERIRPGQLVYVTADPERVGHVGCIVPGWPQGYVRVVGRR